MRKVKKKKKICCLQNKERKVCFLKFFFYGSKMRKARKKKKKWTENVFDEESRCKKWAGVTLLWLWDLCSEFNYKNVIENKIMETKNT